MTIRSTRRLLVFAALTTLSVGQELPPLKHQPPAREQPIPFSHRAHVGKGLACQQCHPMSEPGDFAGIVEADQCMACHTTIKTDSPAIQKLAAYHKSGENIPWEPVYLLADYMYFSHAVHVRKAKVQCEQCHGPVGEREVLAKERDISMAACMDCHRATGGSLACDYCHEPR